MLERLKNLLSEAERLPSWNRNSKTPWLPVIALLADSFKAAASDIHATKIQKRSARKSLWQGRLHRDPIQGLFLAVDEPCDEKAFEALSASVEERFGSPSVWADACLVVSNQKLIGCVEREGVGLAKWLSNSLEMNTAICDSEESQLEIGNRVDAALSPQRFVTDLIAAIREGDKNQARDYLAYKLALSPEEVLISLTIEPPNAAKGRWEGADIDSSVRYRAAVIGADNWTWDSAALEMMHRMQPPDLTLEFALLSAKSRADGEWDRFRAFVSENSTRSEDIVTTFRNGGIHDIHVVAARSRVAGGRQSNIQNEHLDLHVRDADAGEIRYEVSRSKRRVHDFLTNLLRQWADQEGLQVLEGSDSISMYDALVRREEDRDLLIEVKTSSSPGVVRLAVGQLIDYRRVLSREGRLHDCECVLMLPSNEQLTHEMLGLLAELEFSWGALREYRQGAGSKLVLEIHCADGHTYAIPRLD